MAAFDFAFGLRRGGVEEFDTVEVKSLPQLREGVGIVGVKEGMVVHIKRQRQAVGLEDASEEVEVGEQCFAWVETYERLCAPGMLPWQARLARWCGRHSQPVCEWIIPDCDSKFCPQ